MAGYRFLGGRLVATDRGPAALFMYEDERGGRLAVFMRPMARANATAIEPVEAGPVDGCAWIERGIGYTVVAAEPYERLLDLSRQVRQQVQAQG
jgi:anti-sigma factor RsiW